MLTQAAEWRAFSLAVIEAGLQPSCRQHLLWRIEGGVVVVRYQPLAHSGPHITIDGSTWELGGPGATLDRAIHIAKSGQYEFNGERKRNTSGNGRRKRELWKRTKRCYWCRKELTFKTATVDHVIPRSRGGLDDETNTVLACDRCNNDRGSRIGPPPKITTKRKKKR